MAACGRVTLSSPDLVNMLCNGRHLPARARRHTRLPARAQLGLAVPRWGDSWRLCRAVYVLFCRAAVRATLVGIAAMWVGTSR